MMAESDLCTALFYGDRVQNTAPQTRAERAICLALRNVGSDYRKSVFLDDAVRHAARFEIIRQHFLGKIRLFLVAIDGQDLKINGGSPPNVEQQIEHRVAVFTARE